MLMTNLWSAGRRMMPLPSLERARKALEAGEVEQAFWDKHWDDFLERYPEQFVAVKDGQVLAASEDLQEVLQVVQAAGVEPAEIWIQFLTKSPGFLLL
jgi:hypothetical protein